MKRIIFVLVASLSVMSCQTAKPPMDRGVVNPENSVESELATLNTDKFINIVKIDGKDTHWENPSHRKQSQTVKLNPGVHSFSVSFDNGSVYTIFPQTVIGSFEKSKTYVIEGKPANNKLKITIIDVVDKKDIVLDLNKLNGNDPGVLSTYIKYVLNPTMEESNKTVKLENDRMILLYKPDMTYSLTDKSTGIEIGGYRGFVMDFAMSDGKVYLLETDVSKMTKEQFLDKSDYANVARTVLIPVKCSEKSVTYRYVKPDDLKDQEIVFSIQQL